MSQQAVYQVLPSQDDQHRPIFSVVVKRTYDIQANTVITRAEKDRPLVQADEYYDYGDPQYTTIQFETDLVPYKVATDIVFIGKAYAPQGQPVAECSVALQVGHHRKELLITGNRICYYRSNQLPVFSEPQPFVEMAIRYEKAYGGKDRTSPEDMPYIYPRNHLGVGFVIENTKEAVEDLKLPNIEDRQDRLTPERLIVGEIQRWNEQPLPQGLGWYARPWYPRCSYMGVLPAFVPLGTQMREASLGLVPPNQVELARAFKLPSLDPRFFNGASLGLVVPYLRGDEPVQLHHLTSEGQLTFLLPQEIPKMSLDIGLGEQSLEPVLQTLLIRGEDRQVDLVWRGAQIYPGIDWLPQMKCLRVQVD